MIPRNPPPDQSYHPRVVWDAWVQQTLLAKLSNMDPDIKRFDLKVIDLAAVIDSQMFNDGQYGKYEVARRMVKPIRWLMAAQMLSKGRGEAERYYITNMMITYMRFNKVDGIDAMFNLLLTRIPWPIKQ